MYQLLRKRLAGKKGFTLIELIVVIAVIAILAVILIPRFAGFTQSAREKSVLSDARNVQMALEALEAQGQFPATVDYDRANNGNIYELVEGFLGKTIDGTLANVGNTGGLIDFEYSMVFGSQTYTATCTDGNLSSTVKITTVP